ncbi:MAG: VWA domain-containing protein [bacterium]|nr:VWA domain-containing protein [bacterium]
MLSRVFFFIVSLCGLLSPHTGAPTAEFKVTVGSESERVAGSEALGSAEDGLAVPASLAGEHRLTRSLAGVSAEELKRVLVLLDNSGSIHGSDPSGHRKPALKLLLTVLSLGETNLEIVLFDTRTKRIVEPTRISPQGLSRALAQLDGWTGRGGGTQLFSALRSVLSEADQANHRFDHCVVVSDGHLSHSDRDETPAMVAELVRRGIKFQAIGLAANSQSVLANLASGTGGHYTLLDTKQPVGTGDWEAAILKVGIDIVQPSVYVGTNQAGRVAVNRFHRCGLLLAERGTVWSPPVQRAAVGGNVIDVSNKNWSLKIFARPNAQADAFEGEWRAETAGGKPAAGLLVGMSDILLHVDPIRPDHHSRYDVIESAARVSLRGLARNLIDDVGSGFALEQVALPQGGGRSAPIDLAKSLSLKAVFELLQEGKGALLASLVHNALPGQIASVRREIAVGPSRYDFRVRLTGGAGAAREFALDDVPPVLESGTRAEVLLRRSTKNQQEATWGKLTLTGTSSSEIFNGQSDDQGGLRFGPILLPEGRCTLSVVVQGRLHAKLRLKELASAPAFDKWRTAREVALVVEKAPPSPPPDEKLRLHVEITANNGRVGEPLSFRAIGQPSGGNSASRIALLRRVAAEELRFRVTGPIASKVDVRSAEHPRRFTLRHSVQEESVIVDGLIRDLPATGDYRIELELPQKGTVPCSFSMAVASLQEARVVLRGIKEKLGKRTVFFDTRASDTAKATVVVGDSIQLEIVPTASVDQRLFAAVAGSVVGELIVNDTVKHLEWKLVNGVYVSNSIRLDTRGTMDFHAAVKIGGSNIRLAGRASIEDVPIALRLDGTGLPDYVPIGAVHRIVTELVSNGDARDMLALVDQVTVEFELVDQNGRVLKRIDWNPSPASLTFQEALTFETLGAQQLRYALMLDGSRIGGDSWNTVVLPITVEVEVQEIAAEDWVPVAEQPGSKHWLPSFFLWTPTLRLVARPKTFSDSHFIKRVAWHRNEFELNEGLFVLQVADNAKLGPESEVDVQYAPVGIHAGHGIEMDTVVQFAAFVPEYVAWWRIFLVALGFGATILAARFIWVARALHWNDQVHALDDDGFSASRRLGWRGSWLWPIPGVIVGRGRLPGCAVSFDAGEGRPIPLAVVRRRLFGRVELQVLGRDAAYSAGDRIVLGRSGVFDPDPPLVTLDGVSIYFEADPAAEPHLETMPLLEG